MNFEELDLPAWVEKAPKGKRQFREAVHIVLTAIGGSVALRSTMVMKGGLLMAIRYDSTRFTKDADFSTKSKYEKGSAQELLVELDQQLEFANDQLPYDTMCRRQRAEVRPARPDARFPTMSLNIGYAQRSKQAEVDRLMNKQASTVVQIDYSYNEAVYDVEILGLGDGEKITAYSFLNLLAEKYRSLLQQPVRKRNRRQDVYDINLLIKGVAIEAAEKLRLLDLLIASCRERDIEPTRESISNAEVMKMAGEGYEELAPEVDEPLPPFDAAYAAIRSFYEEMPWDQVELQSPKP
jgi:predicted nucleotidyltransferase component of viral defense system